MSSRRKISRWLYREWIMSFSSSRTSAWKPCVWRSPACVLLAPWGVGRLACSSLTARRGSQTSDLGSWRGIFKRRVCVTDLATA